MAHRSTFLGRFARLSDPRREPSSPRLQIAKRRARIARIFEDGAHHRVAIDEHRRELSPVVPLTAIEEPATDLAQAACRAPLGIDMLPVGLPHSLFGVQEAHDALLAFDDLARLGARPSELRHVAERHLLHAEGPPRLVQSA